MDNGFSFASVILSYFLVGGGMFTATLVGRQLQLPSALAAAGVLVAGAFVGGFIAARASRGQTILEAVIGAIAVVGTIVGLAAATPLGKLIWVLAEDQTMKFVAGVGAAGIIGALIGAFLGEKLFGEETRSSVPWLLYSALSVFGAALLAMLCASIVVIGRVQVEQRHTTLDLGTAILIGIGAGCLLAGLAIGASARTRPLIASLLGGGIGVAGFFALVTRASPPDKDATAGLAVLAAGGALVTLIGTGLGWVMFGRRGAA
jgi:hypothetical protein